MATKYLYGGTTPWTASDWTSSDDRVRGGASQSYLTPIPSTHAARFHGVLDITTLGGAGFASQRSTNSEPFDLSHYDGLLLDIEKADGKRYTLTLKDEVAGKRPDGRDQSTTSWEFDFVAHKARVWVPWSDLRATYRGRERKDAGKLRLASVWRVGIMMRSFFGDQEGPFDLTIASIAAVKRHDSLEFPSRYTDDPHEVVIASSSEKTFSTQQAQIQSQNKGWLGWFGSCLRR